MPAQIVDLFPIPLVIEKLEVDNNEINFALNYVSDKTNLYSNQLGNFTSLDSYFLKRMPKLKAQIEKSIKLFVFNILGEEEELKITQSWINCNPPNTGHHLHSHPNSIISGVLYIQTDENTGNIQFHQPAYLYRSMHGDIKNWGKHNYRHVYFTPTSGDLFLFPSTLHHDVVENKSSINRVSLSFNTFYQGVFGSERNLMQVDLRGENGLLTHPKKGKVAKKR